MARNPADQPIDDSTGCKVTGVRCGEGRNLLRPRISCGPNIQPQPKSVSGKQFGGALRDPVRLEFWDYRR